MGRKRALKAVGLFDRAPLAAVPEQPRKPRTAPTREETLHSFTMQMRLDQRQALADAARERVRPTAPGKADASAVWREFFDACFADWWAGSE